MIEFEYDPQKNNHNRQKHGIDFDEAKSLWDDENRVVIPAKSDDEPRFLLIASHKNRHWSAFYTVRRQKIRLISVRRAREEEKELYESERPR